MIGENLRSITKIDNDIILIKTSNNTYMYKAVGGYNDIELRAEWGYEAEIQYLNR